MAILYITEFREFAQIGGSGPVPRVPFVTIQQVTVSTNSISSAAFNKATHAIRLEADTSCGVIFGTPATLPTATTTNSQRIAANVPGEYFQVNPLDSLAVISVS